MGRHATRGGEITLGINYFDMMIASKKTFEDELDKMEDERFVNNQQCVKVGYNYCGNGC